MPLYTNVDQVKARLVGKVRFTDNEDDENKMPETLLRVLIDEAESQVEQDLSIRYSAPFQTVEGQPFRNLPPRPTRLFLQTLCELKSVQRVLETDFGRGSATEGENYYKSIKERYDAMVKQAVGRNDDGATLVGRTGPFTYPALPGLRLNWGNTTADDGYVGAVLNSSMDNGGGDYPAKQIVDPSEGWWNGSIDP